MSNQGKAKRTYKKSKTIKRKVLRLQDQMQYSVCASVAEAIESALDCHIRIVPSQANALAEQAGMCSRILSVSTIWPEHQSYNLWEHWIFFDERLPPESAVLAVAHELGHIYLHLGDDPSDKSVDDKDKITYTDREELEADIFAACVLRHSRADFNRDIRLFSKVKLLSAIRRRVKVQHSQSGSSSSEHTDILRTLIQEGLLG